MADLGDHTSAAKACCKSKESPRSDELKCCVSRRLNRAIGQLKGIRTMVEEDRYCGDVLTQLAAVESAVRAVSREIMCDHLRSCVASRLSRGDLEAADEVSELLRRFM